MPDSESHPVERQPSTSSPSSAETARNATISQPAATAEADLMSDELSRTPTDRPSYAEIASAASAPAPHQSLPSPQAAKSRARTSSSMSTSTNPSNLSSPSKQDAIVEQSDEDDPVGDERFFTPRERVRPLSTQRTRPPSSTLQPTQSRRSISVNTTASKTRQPPPPSRTRQQRSSSRAGVTSAASSAGQGGGGSSGEESEDEDARPRHRRGRQGNSDDEDDEVETKDRGEMLVRKRMRERKEARKAAAMAQKMKEESQRRLSTYTQTGEHGEGDFGYGFPSSASGGRTRDPSAARSERSQAHGLRSPMVVSGAPQLYPTSPLPHSHHPAYPHVPRPSIGGRGASFVSSASGTSRGGSDTEGPGHAGSVVEQDDGHPEDEEPRMEDWRDGGADGPHSPAESVDENGEVEYTLKDRQDAINVEHPFGLPIWKPALYKKSRSIARRAESAVHAAPSSVALHHLLPSNIVWTLVFGTPLFVLCGLIAAVLLITPFGGAKYGRVVWELGTYLAWPFGKYVEGWVEDVGGDDDDDEEETGDARDEPPFRPPRPHGSEQATLRRSDRTLRATASDSAVPRVGGESANLLGTVTARDYGATKDQSRRSSEETIQASLQRSVAPHDFSKDTEVHGWRVRALGRVMYWVFFYGIIAPALLLVAAACWAFVFTIPMAKLLWVLLRHLKNEPLSIYFRSPPDYQPIAQDLALDVEAPDVHADDPTHNPSASVIYPLRVGQPAPPRPPKSVAADRRKGRLRGPHPTVLLCTYRAAGLEYYKYTVDGVNVWFVNLTSLIAIAILDFFILVPYAEKHDVSPFLHLLASQAFVFVIALLSVIPLSYFIGMAVASISAQSSIGMGAVINASFGSIIEIVLYSIALTQAKGELVEGSIVGSLIAGVLLMPGVSMIGGAVRRKEQRFNARSAGVTSTMLIMAVVGVLTPTLFYEIYGSFQLTCTGCTLPTRKHPDENCRTCYYEHVSPADDPFYQTTVVQLSYYCAVLLVLSYLIGLWFSLKTHASQIWQNAPPAHEAAMRAAAQANLADRRSFYQKLVPTQLLKRRPSALGASPLGSPPMTPATGVPPHQLGEAVPPIPPIPPMHLPHGLSHDELQRAIAVVASATLPPHLAPPPLLRTQTHTREVTTTPQQAHGHGHEKEESGEGGQGGHYAPNWSRAKSATVLLACTVLYAIIAEILVDVVDVVLKGSGISEKLLGVILFALVPNTTEFMNAISFALNGNIALSMEIGSAYALQVCLIQIPAMLAFSAWYSIGKESMLHRAFTLVFPRWDAISILFSVFLLSYIYIESRSNYQRGSLLILSYLVLLGGFVFAPNGRDTSDNPEFGPGSVLTTSVPAFDCNLGALSWLKAFSLSLFTR